MTTLLLDASGVIYQGFHASKGQEDQFRLRRRDGFPVAAVREFTRRLFGFIFDGLRGFKPDHIGVIFDFDGPTFRRDLFADYKLGRLRDAELNQQMPLMREAAKALGLCALEKDGYEADDLIATYARLAVEAGHDVIIVTFDKDLYQLVRPGVTVFCPAVGDPRYSGFRPEKWIGPDQVVEKFGVPAGQVIEVQALMGDATDNIPGVPKVGVKTAAELIGQFGSVEMLINFAHTIVRPKLRDLIIEHAETIRLSRQLVALLDDVEVPEPLEALATPDVDPVRLLAFLNDMEFQTLARRVRERFSLPEDWHDAIVAAEQMPC